MPFEVSRAHGGNQWGPEDRFPTPRAPNMGLCELLSGEHVCEHGNAPPRVVLHCVTHSDSAPWMQHTGDLRGERSLAMQHDIAKPYVEFLVSIPGKCQAMWVWLATALTPVAVSSARERKATARVVCGQFICRYFSQTKRRRRGTSESQTLTWARR